MQLFNINTTTGVDIQDEIKHIRFKDVPINNLSGKERDIEDLLIRYPGLLNNGDFEIEDQSNDDLLIISKQPTTAMKKRADLLAIHRDGSLVIIEVKRDAIDERYRAESMEFQAIRYAAASRKMTADAVIDTFARFIQSLSTQEFNQGPDSIKSLYLESSFDSCRQDAIRKLCEHLSDEDNEFEEEDLLWMIDPKENQKIYLVAADYEPDVVSACAWLREHGIDISCFRLRPYRIGSQFVLERERLIPPPELDDYMTDTFSGSSIVTQGPPKNARKSARNQGDKPNRLIWSDDEDNPVNVSTWRAMFDEVVRKALRDGIEPQDLPIRNCTSEDDPEYQRFQAPVYIDSHNLYVDLHASAAAIKNYTQKILKKLNKEGSLRVETNDGDVFQL